MPYASRAPVAPSPSFFFFWKVRPGRCVVLMLRLVVARLICWPKCLSVNSCETSSSPSRLPVLKSSTSASVSRSSEWGVGGGEMRFPRGHQCSHLTA